MQTILYGGNAAGKTTLAVRYALRYPTDSYMISFRDSYGTIDDGYYLQLRWNNQAIDDDMPTAGMLLEKAMETAAARSKWLDKDVSTDLNRRRKALIDKLVPLFGLDRLSDKFIISLSSGELRKFQLTKALLSLPRVLILDNPFIGLDGATREKLALILGELSDELGMELVLLMPRLDIIPHFISHIRTVSGGVAGEAVPTALFRAPQPPVPDCETIRRKISSIPPKDIGATPFYPSGESPEIVRCRSLCIRYGSRTILSDLDWVVHEGEHWAISGENGAGKSTLLSLICADNPQAYACDIELFSHRRGSGESIWDIKRHIGYVSPEMHRAFRHSQKALNIVASGFFDTQGLVHEPDEAQIRTCMTWMEIFGIAGLAGRPFFELSSGEQRLCLLARAFVKDPELLILDEPMHGLDEKNSATVKAVIDEFVKRPHKTLLFVSHFEEEFPSCIDHRLKLKTNI